jgi:hypothetical protein
MIRRAATHELDVLLAQRHQVEGVQIKLDGHDLILSRQTLAALCDVLSEIAPGIAGTVA